MPQMSSDFRTYTVPAAARHLLRRRPGLRRPQREVTAQDVVYTYKRIFDPKYKSPQPERIWTTKRSSGWTNCGQRAQATGRFDYDSEVEGLRALDRYTVQFRLAEPRPRFVLTMADPGSLGIVAREVVEKYGDQIMEHPVGTGPFMLQEWQRSSKITLVRNPNFREEYYDAHAGGGRRARPRHSPRA